MNKLWFKSEGFVEHGRASDGDTEALYDRPLPYLRYFDAQAGVRYDLDSDPGRTWCALGIEGLAPMFFEFEPPFYFSNRGRFAGRLMGSYDPLITQRLILQAEIEMNFYSKRDPSRTVGSGPFGPRYGTTLALRDRPRVRSLYRRRLQREIR
jgi:copper resistance protein B